jgi:GINS complex subunit 4
LRLVEGHFQGAVLEQLPSDLQKLDDTAQGLSMVNSPDINTAVFVKVVEDLPTIADGRWVLNMPIYIHVT